MKNLQTAFIILVFLIVNNNDSFAQSVMSTSSYKFSQVNNFDIGLKTQDLTSKTNRTKPVDYHTIKLDANVLENQNPSYEPVYYETESKKMQGFAAGAVIGGALGLVLGMKLGIKSAEGDGLAGIVTGPLKAGLLGGLGLAAGIGVGGSIGSSLAAKVNVPIQNNQNSNKEQEKKVQELRRL